MTTNALRATEAECAAGRTAPRVSLDDITSKIAQAYYFTGEDVTTKIAHDTGPEADAVKTLTICLLVLNNGFTVVGKAAPASPENFDPELGRKLAYEDAVRQTWPLMGFALRDRLSEAARHGNADKGDEAETTATRQEQTEDA